MSPEAREHAVRNERLPLRVVVQVLFMEQMSLKDAIVKELQCFENQSINDAGDDVEVYAESVSCGEEELSKVEIERMRHKVVELERQCSTIRNEIECPNCVKSSNNVVKKSKGGVWKEIKRKFGFCGSVHDCPCQGKKKKRKKMLI